MNSNIIICYCGCSINNNKSIDQIFILSYELIVIYIRFEFISSLEKKERINRIFYSSQTIILVEVLYIVDGIRGRFRRIRRIIIKH